MQPCAPPLPARPREDEDLQATDWQRDRAEMSSPSPVWLPSSSQAKEHRASAGAAVQSWDSPTMEGMEGGREGGCRLGC